MPNTIADNLQHLVDAKTAIAGAITAKGGTVNTGDGFEAFPADILTIPTGGGSEEITGTISGSHVANNSIAKRFGDIVIIYIYYNAASGFSGTLGTVEGLVTTDEFNNKTDILAVAGITYAKGTQWYYHGITIPTVTTSCSNNRISVRFFANPYTTETDTIYGVQCVVAFKV